MPTLGTKIVSVRIKEDIAEQIKRDKKNSLAKVIEYVYRKVRLGHYQLIDNEIKVIRGGRAGYVSVEVPRSRYDDLMLMLAVFQISLEDTLVELQRGLDMGYLEFEDGHLYGKYIQ